MYSWQPEPGERGAVTLTFHSTHLPFWGLTAKELPFGHFHCHVLTRDDLSSWGGKYFACATLSTFLYSYQENGKKPMGNPVFSSEITNSSVLKFSSGLTLLSRDVHNTQKFSFFN